MRAGTRLQCCNQDFLLAPIQQATHPVVLSLVCEQISGDGSNTHRTRDFPRTRMHPEQKPGVPPPGFLAQQGVVRCAGREVGT